MVRAKMISRRVRQRHFYSVPQAGQKVGLGRTQSYEAARLGQIPTEQAGKFLLVPRQAWDRKVKTVLRGPALTSRAPHKEIG